jgi:hypothetical protein
MSGITFSQTFSSPTLPSTTAAAGRNTRAWLRTAAIRVRRVKAAAVDLNDTYSVVEGVCLLVAAGFGSAVLAMAFGVRL